MHDDNCSFGTAVVTEDLIFTARPLCLMHRHLIYGQVSILLT